MGRTNKLVDGCYSYWQGGLFPLLQSLRLPSPSPTAAGKGDADAAEAARAAVAGMAGGSRQPAPVPAQQTASAAAEPAVTQRSAAQQRITVPPLPPLSGRSMVHRAADSVAALQALDVEHRSSAAPSADVTEASAMLHIVGPTMHPGAEGKQTGCGPGYGDQPCPQGGQEWTLRLAGCAGWHPCGGLCSGGAALRHDAGHALGLLCSQRTDCSSISGGRQCPCSLRARRGRRQRQQQSYRRPGPGTGR